MHKGLACVGAYKWHSSGRWGGCNYSHSCKVCAFLKILQMQHGDKGQLELPHPKLPFRIHVKKWPDSNYVQRQHTWGNRRERPPTSPTCKENTHRNSLVVKQGCRKSANTFAWSCFEYPVKVYHFSIFSRHVFVQKNWLPWQWQCISFCFL